MSTVKFFCETLKLLSRISGRIPDIRQNKLAGYPAAGYPANSVSGATLNVILEEEKMEEEIADAPADAPVDGTSGGDNMAGLPLD